MQWNIDFGQHAMEYIDFAQHAMEYIDFAQQARECIYILYNMQGIT